MLISCTDDSGSSHKKEPTLEQITLSGEYQTTFYVDDTFSYTGLVVTAYYSDQSSQVVADYQISSPVMSQLGKQDVVVTYNNKQASYEITINEAPIQPTLVRIDLSGTYKTEFEVGDTFNYEGLMVNAIYDNGDSVTVTDYQVSSPDMNVVGEQKVRVTYFTVFKEYTINIKEKEDPEEETYEGYMYLAFYRLDIEVDSKSKNYLNPGIKDKDNKDVDVGDFPFTFEVSNSDIIEVSKYGAISSKKAGTGESVVTCVYTKNNKITAKCVVSVVNKLPTRDKKYQLVTDYDALKDGDILVIAAPSYGLTASLDTLRSKLNPVESKFSSDYKVITELGEGTIEFYLGIEEKGMTLESQTGEYLKCTHQGKVTLDSSLKTNRYWDIHSNIDPETGEGSLDDGAVIENNVESLGYMMFNVSLRYFTTYVENSLRPGVMELPFIYKLDYLN